MKGAPGYADAPPSNHQGSLSVNHWDTRFLELARLVSTWSKDVSTQVGATIADGKIIVSVGFNGFAQGVVDRPEWLADRETKLALTIHSEANALLHAERSVAGCTIYTWPLPPCAHCAALIVQRRLGRVVTVAPSAEHQARWGTSFQLARTQFSDAGIAYLEIEDATGG